MNAPISCFCAGVNSSALTGAAVQATPTKAAARPKTVVSFIQLSRLRPRPQGRPPIFISGVLKGDNCNFVVALAGCS